MVTTCPNCDEQVRPVVTTREADDDEDADTRLDRERGYHCPDCGYKFADTDEVFTDEHTR